MQQRGPGGPVHRKIGTLTRDGFRLAEIAVTASRSIAAGIAGFDDRSFLPLLDQVDNEALPDERDGADADVVLA